MGRVVVLNDTPARSLSWDSSSVSSAYWSSIMPRRSVAARRHRTHSAAPTASTTAPTEPNTPPATGGSAYHAGSAAGGDAAGGGARYGGAGGVTHTASAQSRDNHDHAQTVKRHKMTVNYQDTMPYKAVNVTK